MIFRIFTVFRFLGSERSELRRTRNRVMRDNPILIYIIILIVILSTASPTSSLSSSRIQLENDTEKALSLLEQALKFEFSFPFDQVRALSHYNSSARLGNNEALFTMGILHSTAGLGVSLDPVIALSNYHVAAMKGHKGAQRALGYRYLYGIGVPKNCTLALTYYELVANAVMRERDVSPLPPTIPDIDKIYDASSTSSAPERQTNHLVEYYTSLSESGNPEAHLRMGFLHLRGTDSNGGTSQDFDRAFEYFTEASESAKKSATKVNARLALAHMHFRGLGSLESNATKAFEIWSDILQVDNNGDAHNGIGVLYLLGATKETPKDPLKARSLFTKASERGSVNGFYNLGISYLRGTGRDDRSFAKAAQFMSLAVRSIIVHSSRVSVPKLWNKNISRTNFLLCKQTGTTRLS